MTCVNLFLPPRIRDPSWLCVWTMAGELKGIVKRNGKKASQGKNILSLNMRESSSPAVSLRLESCSGKTRVLSQVGLTF